MSPESTFIWPNMVLAITLNMVKTHQHIYIWHLHTISSLKTTVTPVVPSVPHMVIVAKKYSIGAHPFPLPGETFLGHVTPGKRLENR